MKSKLFTLILLVLSGFLTPFIVGQNSNFTEVYNGFSTQENTSIAQDYLPYYYNHAEVICGLHAATGFGFNMGPEILKEPFPGCTHCCTMENPQWLVFVGGPSIDNKISIEISISDCFLNQGVQIAMYKLPCDTEFDPTEQSIGLLPTNEMLISECQDGVSLPMQGTFLLELNGIEEGSLYGIMVDGWVGDQCWIEILEVREGGDPPQLGGNPNSPIYENLGWGEDTLCIMPQGSVFRLEDKITAACSYNWTLENLETSEKSSLESLGSGIATLVHFPDAGRYEVCVTVSNACDTSSTACRMVTVITNDDILEHPESIIVEETEDALFEVVSTVPGATYQWQADFGQGFQNLSQGNPFFGVNSPNLLIRNVSQNLDGLILRCLVLVDNCSSISDEAILNVRSIYPPDAKHCTFGPTQVVEVVNPITGRIWMDRNLGAQRRAFIPRDKRAFGDLYQWGRFSDGHQCRNSPDTLRLSETNRPEHGHFIVSNDFPQDWRTERSDELWDGIDAENNPCPDGFRVPTISEWREEVGSAGTIGTALTGTSWLYLPLAGMRQPNGNQRFEGIWGFYWSSTVAGDRSQALSFTGNFILPQSSTRASGYAVRCIKEDVTLTDDSPRETLWEIEESKAIQSNTFTNGLEILVYPNPTTGVVNLKIGGIPEEGGFQIRVIDVIGKEVLRFVTTDNLISLNLNSLQSGIYFIQISGIEGDVFGIERLLIK